MRGLVFERRDYLFFLFLEFFLLRIRLLVEVFIYIYIKFINDFFYIEFMNILKSFIICIEEELMTVGRKD